MSKEELIFASENEAFQHLADLTGRSVKIATASWLSSFGDDSKFDIAQGLYWFAADYHGGQTSILYSILSQLEYKPGASENKPDEGGVGEMVYDHLASLSGSDQDDAAEEALAYVK